MSRGLTTNMNKRKDSLGTTGSNVNPKRKSSLGLRNWMSSADDRLNDAPSTSRPQPMQRTYSNLGMHKGNDFSSSSRIPRLPPPSYSSRRSSSQEPPTYRKRLNLLSPGSDMQHMSNVGVLLTPVRSMSSFSPSTLSVASSARWNSSARRISQKLVVSGPIKMKDERPVNDKLFQANAMNQIQSFMRSHSDGGQSHKLKPMSNTALIATFNTIVSELDPNMRVSKEDYVAKIPSILNSLQYPVSITKSSYVAVGSGTATQQLIAMLAWLVDSVTALSNINPDMCLFPNADLNKEEKILKGSYLTLFDAYGQFKQGGSVTEATLLDLFCKHTGDSLDKECQIQTDIEELKIRLEAQKTDPVREANEGKLQQIAILEEEVNTFQKQYDTNSDNLKSLKSKNLYNLPQDVDLGRLDDQAAELQDQVEKQSMKSAERDSIRTQCGIMRENIAEKHRYQEKLQELIGKVDIDIANTRKKVGNITQDINCLVLEKGLDESLKWKHNPLCSDTANEYLLSMQQLWSSMYQRINMELEDKQATLKAGHQQVAKLKEDLQRKKLQLESKKEEIRRLGAEMITIQLESTELEQKLCEDIEKEKAACCKLQELLNHKPKLAHVVECIKAILEEKNY
ncbi:hypothetical protein B566_EDAN012437 [Ephemera danica]|nr:hypothetical protein B566_EDAN012437 [Ephemera danica]